MQHVSEREINALLPPTYLTLSNDLRSVTIEIMNNTMDFQRHSEYMTNNGMVVFARQIAKELGRPFMPYRHGTLNAWIEVPNLKYLEPVHAPLRLVAKPWQNRWKYEDQNDTPLVEFARKSKYTEYRFNSEEGVKIFESWKERVLSEPDLRAALKLPPK